MPTVADLGKAVKQKYPGMYDDMPDSSLGAKVKGKYPGAYDDYGGTTAPQAGPKRKGLGRQFLESAVNQLPMEGGILGGGIAGTAGLALGGPGLSAAGAVGGADIGGQGGEALKQLASRALGMEDQPATPQQAVSNIATQGGIQGLYEGVPKIAGPAAKKAGLALMQSVGKLTPEMAQTALDEGIRATRGGFDKAMGTLGDLGQAIRRVVDAHTKSGVRFDPNTDVVQGAVQDVLPMAQHGMNPEADIQKIKDMAKSWLEGRDKPTPPGGYTAPGEVTPTQLLKDRQRAETIAAPTYDERGTKITPTLEQSFAKAIADRIRGRLNSLPGVQPLNERASKLIDLKEALWPVAQKDKPFLARAAGRSLPVLAGGMAGAMVPGSWPQRGENAALGATLGAGIGTPGMASNVALALQGPQNPMLQMLLSQLPRLAGTALAQPDQTAQR